MEPVAAVERAAISMQLDCKAVAHFINSRQHDSALVAKTEMKGIRQVRARDLRTMQAVRESARKANHVPGATAMAKYGKQAANSVKRAVKKAKKGTLKSGKSGKKVKSRKQAIAIGLSEARKKGSMVPKMKTAKKK